MIKKFFILVSVIGVAILGYIIWHDDLHSGAFKDPWVRSAKIGQNSAAYVAIDNGSIATYKIVRARSEIAQTVELHESTEENGIHKMRPVSSIKVAAKSITKLAPGGLHVMLIGLKRDIIPDQIVPITFVLTSGHSIIVNFKAHNNGCGSCCN